MSFYCLSWFHLVQILRAIHIPITCKVAHRSLMGCFESWTLGHHSLENILISINRISLSWGQKNLRCFLIVCVNMLENDVWLIINAGHLAELICILITKFCHCD